MSPVLLQYVIAAVVTTAEGTLNLLYAPYLDGYGYTLPTIGSLSALLAIFRLVSRVPVGASYHATRAKRQLAFWLVVFTVATSGFALAQGNVVAVIALTVVHGYAFGALGTVNLAITIDLTEGKRAGAIMGWYTAALSTGYAVGAFLGGAAADALGIPTALAILGLLPALFAAATLALPAIVVPAPALPRGPGLAALWRAHRDLDPRVWIAFVIVIYLNVLSDSVDTFFPLFALSIGLPLAATGFLKGIKSGAATFIRFVSGALFRFVDHRTVNFWGVVLFALSTLLIPIGTPFAILFALFLVAGFCRGLLRVTSAAMVAELRAEGRDVGVSSGVYNAGLDIGAIVGPAVGGVLGNVLGLGPMFQVVALGSVALYFAVALSSARGRATLGLRMPAVILRGR